MRSRKHTAWKKSRTFGDIKGGRMRPRMADNIFQRLHTLKAPGPGTELPVLAVDNPSSAFHYPMGGDETLGVLRSIPGNEGITHLWLRRRRPGHKRQEGMLAEFICGSGVRLITMYAWRDDRRIKIGRRAPRGAYLREVERFGARAIEEDGLWWIEFDEEGLRQYWAFVLAHEVGHHVDWLHRRWSSSNRRKGEVFADQFALQCHVSGTLVSETQDAG